MYIKGISLLQEIKVTDVTFTDRLEGLVTFTTNTLKEISACLWGYKFKKGDVVTIEFYAVGCPHEWEVTFSKNKEEKLKLVQSNETTAYDAYGKIISINPVIADFGDLKLNIGNWTNDDKVIGEFIYWKIHRLEAKKIL